MRNLGPNVPPGQALVILGRWTHDFDENGPLRGQALVILRRWAGMPRYGKFLIPPPSEMEFLAQMGPTPEIPNTHPFH